MKAIVGLDTATPVVAVAVTRGEEVLREAEHGPDQEGRPRHSSLLLREIEACAEAAGGWDEVERIAVGIGPGSFTGLRIGIATARALGQGRGVPLAGVGTLAALGLAIRDADRSGRPSLPVLDARRDEAFAALFGPGGEELWPPTVLGPGQLGERVQSLEATPVAAGDGSLRFREQLEAAGAEVPGPEDPVHRIAARHICALGRAKEASPPDGIEPIYLRAPDAERWRERDSKDLGG
jgi:tRNA threonylcarbamoyladenosine biosynthesis protein TsaB